MFYLIKHKRRVVAYLFLIGILSSCRSSVELLESNNKNQQSLEIPSLSIEKAEVVEWKLGKKREKIISKGVRVSLELPHLKSDLAKLIYEKGANSWIIKTVKHYNGGRDILDFGYIPFIIESGLVNGEVSVSKNSKHFIQVSYSGVRMPKRFEEKNCPLFGHKKIVDDYSVNEIANKTSIVLLREARREPGRHHKSSLEPQVVDAGNSIIGKYFFYIPLMNSKTKTLMSSYIPYSEYLQIKSEYDGELGEECLGFRQR